MADKRVVEIFSDFRGEFSKGKTNFLQSIGTQSLVLRKDKQADVPPKQSEEDETVCKIFDAYYFFYQEKNSEETQSSWKEAKMNLQPLNFYYVEGLKDICSAYFSGNSKIVVSGWKNNKLFTGILLRRPKEDTTGWENIIEETIDTEHVFGQVATYDNFFIGASFTSGEMLIKSMDDPTHPIIYTGKGKPLNGFYQDFASFSRVFSIRESFLFYLTDPYGLRIIDLDKLLQHLSDKQSVLPESVEWAVTFNGYEKVCSFSVYQNSIALLTKDRRIFRHRISETGVDAEPLLKTDMIKSKNFDYHTIYQFNPGFAVAIGTKEASTIMHNKVVLFDSRLEQTSFIYLEKVFLNSLTNPIQSCKAVPKNNLTFLVLSSALTFISILAVLEKKLQLMALNIRIGPSRMNGLCLYTQYQNRILLFGFDEFADYSVERLLPVVANT